MKEPGPVSDPITPVPEKTGLLSAWQYSQYRLLLISSLGFYTGRWMETVVGAWLVLELTNSPFQVGLLGTCRFLAMLLGPFCGTISDRFNRRRILIMIQVVYATGALIIMMLFIASRLEVWHIFAFTIVGGISYTFDFSSRYAAAADIVKSQHLVAAVSLLNVSQGITSIFGPLLGGSLLGLIKVSGCFALITGSFLLSFLMLLPLKISVPAKPTAQESMWRGLVEGLVYIKKDKTLLALILIAALVNLFVFPYWFTLIPLFARDILNTGAGGYGQLMAAIGLGYTVGSLLTAALPDFINKGKLLIAVAIAWPAILIIFANSGMFALSLILLVFTGIAQGMTVTIIISLLLKWSSAEMRGRVTGIRAFAISTIVLGNLFTGAGAGLWGAPTMLVVSASTSILITIIITIWASELLRRK